MLLGQVLLHLELPLHFVDIISVFTDIVCTPNISEVVKKQSLNSFARYFSPICMSKVLDNLDEHYANSLVQLARPHLAPKVVGGGD